VATKTKTPLALAKQVLDIELAGLKAVRAQLDAQFTLAVETLAEALSRRNKLVVVGIGKSGNIGQKMAATFNSTGATSVLLDPANALHGDIGLLDDGDDVLELPLAQVMTAKPTVLREDALAVEALKIFNTRKIDDLIVVNTKREPVGLIDSQDLPKLKLA
jgi:CBS domain-containing protein